MKSVGVAGVLFAAGTLAGGGGGALRGAIDWKEAYPGLLLIDGHSHDLVPLGGSAPRQGELQRARAAGMNGVILSFPLERTGPEDLVERIRRDMALVHSYATEKAVSLGFVDRFDFSSAEAAAGPFQVLPSLEYFDGVFRGDLAVLDALHAAGIRSITLADHPGDGISQRKGDALRLSDFGRRVVDRMNDMGMAIDISHLPRELQGDVIRTSRLPVFASHSNLRAVAAVGRNLWDDVLKEMCDRGGLVLLTFDREYLLGDSGDPSSPGIPRLLAHVGHAVALCGFDHVGIGTDFLGSGRNAPADLREVECFEEIAKALTRSGYATEDVRKILGGNLIRFFSDRDDPASKADTAGERSGPSFVDFRSLRGPYLGQTPPDRIPRVFAPGFVSSEKMELNSVFTPDGGEFYFSLRIPERRYRMFFTRREDSGWTNPRPVPFGSASSDVDMSVTADGRRMYFSSTRPSAGREAGDFGIWYVDRVGNGWGEARYLEGPVNAGTRALYPTVTRTGTIYFQGVRPDSLGGRDIYRARLSVDGYGEPEHLDEAVNSAHGEGDILIAPDESWLIVSCVDRTDGLGAGDLYVSFRKQDGAWSKLRNMGPPVNSEANEYCPMLSPDGRYLFFTSSRTGNGDIYWVDAAVIDGLRDGAYLGQQPPGLTPELFAPGTVTSGQSEGCSGWGAFPEWFLFQRWIDSKSVLFLIPRDGRRWLEAERLPWTDRYQVGDFTVGPDGRTVAFVSSIPIADLGAVGEGGNIWIAERTSSCWTEPRPAGPGVNTDFHDSYPSLATSGNMYFFSRRPGGFGQSDLYVSRRRDGRYLPAENLGATLNTDAHEWDPYVAPDESYLLFNSTKPGGLGGDDFYGSWKTASGTWGDPVHLGPEINSSGSDNRPYVTADGRYFFFTSDRRGNRDIYWVDARILERFRPEG